MRHQEIPHKDYKENEFDMVFEAWQSVNGQLEAFEARFNTKKNKLSNFSGNNLK